MYGAYRNIGRLVFGQEFDRSAAGYASRSTDDHPMFGAMVMHLQRQFRSWLHGYPLYLKAFAQIDPLVAAPRAMHGRMSQMLAALLLPELVDDLLDALHLILVNHKNRVLRLHDDQVFDAYGGDKAAFRANHRIANRVGVDVAAQDIPVPV